MYDFILQLIFIGSLSVIVFMLARALPRVAQPESRSASVYDYVDRWLGNLPLHHVDQRLSNFWEKWLRRTRIVLMKADNYLLHKINNSRKSGNGAGDNGGSIKELLEQINSEDK